MGIFSMFFGKKATPQQKREIEAMLSRMRTCCKRLESVNSIDSYFTEWEKYLSEYRQLSAYADQGIKFSVSPRFIHEQILKEVPRIEKDVVSRGYDRLQRDSAKLSTDKGKQKKADSFFNELEFYFPRLQQGTVTLIKDLRAKDKFATKETNTFPVGTRFCPKCGSPLDEGAVFCGKCGNQA